MGVAQMTMFYLHVSTTFIYSNEHYDPSSAERDVPVDGPQRCSKS
jgi:hypothetical protein